MWRRAAVRGCTPARSTRSSSASSALIYFALAKIGLMLASINPSASPIWPPTGLALAALLLRGYRVWPAILVAAFAANRRRTAGSIATSLAIGAGNTIEGLLGAYLINRLSDGKATFESPAGVARFALLSFLPTALCATIGVISLALGGLAEPRRVGLGLADLVARRPGRRAAGHAGDRAVGGGRMSAGRAAASCSNRSSSSASPARSA